MNVTNWEKLFHETKNIEVRAHLRERHTLYIIYQIQHTSNIWIFGLKSDLS